MTFYTLLLNKFWLKVISVLLATLIWFVIQTNFSSPEMRWPRNPLQATDARVFNEPVVVLVSASNRRLFQIEPAEVRVTLRGAPGLLARLTPEDVQVFVRLVDVAEAQGSFRLEAKLPPEFNPQDVSIFPANVQIKPLPLPLTRPESKAP